MAAIKSNDSLKGTEDTDTSCGRRSPELDRPNMKGDENTDAACSVKRQSLGEEYPNISRMRIVLVGKTGAGKSSTGNTIFGRKVFTAITSGSSVTKVCWKEIGEVAGTKVEVVDTPGLFDTNLPEKDLKHEIRKCINMTAPGPHAIILVIQLGPFTEEERSSVEKVCAVFGKDADKYTVILFTRGDELEGSIEEYLLEAPEDLKQLIKKCGKRYHVFDNTDMNNRTQVVELLEKIDNMVESNGSVYTCDMYKDVERKLRDKEEELKQFYEMKMAEKEKELTSKYLKEKKKLMEKIKALESLVSDYEKELEIKNMGQTLDKKKMRELREVIRYYKEKQRAARQEAEQIQHHDIIVTRVCGKSFFQVAVNLKST